MRCYHNEETSWWRSGRPDDPVIGVLGLQNCGRSKTGRIPRRRLEQFVPGANPYEVPQQVGRWGLLRIPAIVNGDQLPLSFVVDDDMGVVREVKALGLRARCRFVGNRCQFVHANGHGCRPEKSPFCSPPCRHNSVLAGLSDRCSGYVVVPGRPSIPNGRPHPISEMGEPRRMGAPPPLQRGPRRSRVIGPGGCGRIFDHGSPDWRVLVVRTGDVGRPNRHRDTVAMTPAVRS